MRKLLQLKFSRRVVISSGVVACLLGLSTGAANALWSHELTATGWVRSGWARFTVSAPSETLYDTLAVSSQPVVNSVFELDKAAIVAELRNPASGGVATAVIMVGAMTDAVADIDYQVRVDDTVLSRGVMVNVIRMPHLNIAENEIGPNDSVFYENYCNSYTDEEALDQYGEPLETPLHGGEIVYTGLLKDFQLQTYQAGDWVTADRKLIDYQTTPTIAPAPQGIVAGNAPYADHTYQQSLHQNHEVLCLRFVTVPNYANTATATGVATVYSDGADTGLDPINVTAQQSWSTTLLGDIAKDEQVTQIHFEPVITSAR